MRNKFPKLLLVVICAFIVGVFTITILISADGSENGTGSYLAENLSNSNDNDSTLLEKGHEVNDSSIESKQNTSSNTNYSNSSFSKKMKSNKWIEEYDIKVPAFMNHSNEVETDEDGHNFEVYSYGNVILSYSFRAGWTAFDFPDDCKALSPNTYIKSLTYSSNKHLIWSGYTNDGRIFYTAMKEYPEGEAKSSCIWSVIYPKEEQNVVEPLIKEIMTWGKK